MKIKFTLPIILIIFKLIVSQAFAEDSVQESFANLHKKNWSAAQQLALKTRNKTLVKIILSQRLLDNKCTENNFVTAVKFLRDNPKWPQNALLKLTAEQYLNCNTDKRIILEWFDKNPPLTGKGYKFYALAASKLVKDPKILLPIIRKGWIYGDFTAAEEKEYYAKWRKHLTMENHIKRIEEHLWKLDISEAKRSMHLVSKGYQEAFNAQIAILNKTKSAEKLFRKVPEKYYTSGLLFSYLDFKKKEIPTAESIALFKKVKDRSSHFAEWCRLQSYYAREFIDHKDFASSYKIMAIPFAECPDTIREQEWLAGWLALRFLNKPDQALSHFNKYIKIVKTPMSLSRGFYWLARSYEAKRNKDLALQFYKKAAKYSYTFYGQIAKIELKEHKIIIPSRPKIEFSHKQALEKNEVVKALKLLIKYKQSSLAVIYAKSAIVEATSKSEILLITNIIKESNNVHYTASASRFACQYHACVAEDAFPTPYKILNSPVDSHLTYSIIRQESVFDHSAVSTAKAMGLMQLIEQTACDTALAIGAKCNIAQLTKDPKYNIELGTNYLKLLLEQHNNSYLLTFISYNAGPHRAKNWVEKFGDPRKMKDMRQVIDWIELIPFSETRNYVQRVFENMQIYRAILNKDNRLQLRQDLHACD